MALEAQLARQKANFFFFLFFLFRLVVKIRLKGTFL